MLAFINSGLDDFKLTLVGNSAHMLSVYTQTISYIMFYIHSSSLSLAEKYTHGLGTVCHGRTNEANVYVTCISSYVCVRDTTEKMYSITYIPTYIRSMQSRLVLHICVRFACVIYISRMHTRRCVHIFFTYESVLYACVTLVRKEWKRKSWRGWCLYAYAHVLSSTNYTFACWALVRAARMLWRLRVVVSSSV